MRNGDNGVIFESQDPILFRTQRVETLSDLKSLILSKLWGTQASKIGRVAYRLLAPIENGVFRFRLFRLHGDEHVRLMFDIHGRIMSEQVMELSAEVGHGGSGSSAQDTYVQDNRPLAPPPIHITILENEAEEGEEESDEDYVADSGDSESSDDNDEDEFVPETPAGVVPSHYHSLDLDAMHERISVSDTCGVDCNLDSGVEFRVGHRFRSREAVLQGLKNYSICRSAEFRVIECDRLKYHVQCRQADSGCKWSLRVALRQNLGYCPTHLSVSRSYKVRSTQAITSNPHTKRCVWRSRRPLHGSTVIGKSRTTRCQNYFRHCRAVFQALYVAYASNRIMKVTSWCATAACSTKFFGLFCHVLRPSTIASHFSL
ncbi:hypothetical protein Ahy_A03g012798 isoform D [Arachis hypogaea]|uniref:Transposase MuDR plant domain-containing protein n=1 Tax=Arachis hypogaea TaxID=3818 RepID=A0A445DU65_ARAHY|nr:hypothetical protein Ahy_A03g012798 isoform D [Arachis hypogaea]